MRVRFLSAFVLLGACAEEHPEAPGETCQRAAAMRNEALNSAMAGEPVCTADSDCVQLDARVECPNLVMISDCGMVVHRDVRDRYEAARVSERICRALAGSEYGCSLQPSCIASGPPVCEAGQCVASPLF